MSYFKLPKTSFALIAQNDEVHLYEGKIETVDLLKEVEIIMQKCKELVFLNPFRTITARGYEAQGDEPILLLIPAQKQIFSRSELIQKLSPEPVGVLTEIIPQTSDRDFADLVEQVKSQEIEGGNGAQVVLSRIFESQIKDFHPEDIFKVYRNLLQKKGAYMTFLFGDLEGKEPHFFIGASPEMHLQTKGETTSMSPIAGTMAKGDFDDFEPRLINFLNNKKEINELFQVLDEEFKMMAKLCPKGGVITGPYLHETGAVIHTRYHLKGHRTKLKSLQALTHTLHAPTLVGGPMESAARIIAQYEKTSRRYYGGELCVCKEADFDSSILIRSAEVDRHGRVRVQAGAGIVRDSDPLLEVQETCLKAQGFFGAFSVAETKQTSYLDEVGLDLERLLEERNKRLSSFHFEDQSALRCTKSLQGLRVLIINNEDDFAEVLGHMVRHMGMEAQVLDTFDVQDLDFDFIIFGPGPGNINDTKNPRMVRLKELVAQGFKTKKRLIGICLGHQAIASHQAIEVVQKPICTQGVAQEIEVFGCAEICGFYNSFAPQIKGEDLNVYERQNAISFQFHPESVMTKNGYNILVKAFEKLQFSND